MTCVRSMQRNLPMLSLDFEKLFFCSSKRKVTKEKDASQGRKGHELRTRHQRPELVRRMKHPCFSAAGAAVHGGSYITLLTSKAVGVAD